MHWYVQNPGPNSIKTPISAFFSSLPVILWYMVLIPSALPSPHGALHLALLGALPSSNKAPAVCVAV